MLPHDTLTLEERDLIEAVLEYAFNPGVLQRGQGLYAAGNVDTHIKRKEGEWQDEWHFQSTVLGSSNKHYQARLTLDLANALVMGICSCPYRFNCKHSAALAYALLDPTSAGGSPATTTPEDWLSAFHASFAPRSADAGPQSWQLCYLIHPGEDHAFLLALAQRYRKQSGGWGRLQPLSPAQVERYHSLQAADRELLSLVRGARTRPVYRGTLYLEHCYQAKGVLGHQMLEWALRSRRAQDLETLQPWHWGPLRALTFEWQAMEGGERLVSALSPAPEDDWQLYDTLTPPLYHSGQTLGPTQTPLTPEQLHLIQNMPPLSSEQKTLISMQLLHRYDDLLPAAEALPEVKELSKARPGIRLLGAATPGAGLLPALRFEVHYDELSFQPGYNESQALAQAPVEAELITTADTYVRLHRDRPREAEWAQRLRSLSLAPCDYGDENGELWMPVEVQAARHILAWNRLLPSLNALAEEEDWALEIDASYRLDEGTARLSGEAIDAGHGWFDLKLNLHLEGTELNTETLLEHWLQANTPDSLAVRGEDEHWRTLDMRPLKPILGLLRELYDDGGLEGPVRLPSFKAVELEDIEDINVKQAPALRKLRRDLKNFKGIQAVTPARQLRAELRDYQQQGLNWLMFLHRYGFGGILADDMGLGKTLQTLAFVQRLKAGRKLTRGALIVAPTSLIWNWQREAEKFTPNLSVVVLHGPERRQWLDAIAGHDMVITSYGLIHRDFDVHAQHTYDVAVLDEAQNIKNRLAKTTRRVKQLPAGMRLCLTGTPLENHLGELWSLTDYALPGLLASEEQFRQNFRQPIEQQGDGARAQALSRRMAPFMLRRTKAEVVSELPAKTEIQQRVHLQSKQQALYEGIRASMEKRVRELIKSKGLAKSRIEFLDALLKLRQACIDPRLVKLKDAAGIEQSAKMEWLVGAVPEMVEEGRKILLFSQFTQVLDLVYAELHRLGIDSVKLTGRTRKREAAIRAFQDGPVPVFLISLKAGGAGLNLTAADTVIHMDPWWNPALESQATDRAYRIGQDKPVFVYRLVAEGTVEEKIQQMQQHKQQLADSLFDQTRESGLPGSSDELLALFQS